jgi:GAF domain-containing protein
MQLASEFTEDLARYAALMNHRLTPRIIGDVKSVELVEAAARRFGVPLASIGLIGRTKVHFVAEIGTGLHVLPRELAFSTHAIDRDSPIVVEDALLNPRFATHPTVVARHVRFFAAAPLVDRDRRCVGAFCIIDRKPRTMTAEAVAQLECFAARAMQRIDFLVVISDLSRCAEDSLEAGRFARELSRCKDA